MISSTPLLKRNGHDNLAWLCEPLLPFKETSGAISANTFLAHVHSVAQQLPDAEHAINLCENRYLFLVSLCAVVVKQQCNLLPSNKNIATQERLTQRYSNTYIIHDGCTDLANVEQVNLRFCELEKIQPLRKPPLIPIDHLAVISFTSGSTGDAKPNLKTWHTLTHSTAINAHYMLTQQEGTVAHLATVPGQHMWGLETSVLFALFNNVCLVDARPLFPSTIANILKKLPEPRTLISTPLHLRALYQSNIKLPQLVSILSATAPLNQDLALSIEKTFNTELREVYGCSECGSMAIRRTAQTDLWLRFERLNFAVNKNGKIQVSAHHLPESIELEDQIDIVDNQHFKLKGRSSDQINIAGKRGSLDEINKVLNAFSGLVDGVVFFPKQKKSVPRLVAIVVLAEGVDKKQLRAHFRETLDAAFVPRPILVVQELPREDNGKLVKSKLLAFYHSLINA